MPFNSKSAPEAATLCLLRHTQELHVRVCACVCVWLHWDVYWVCVRQSHTRTCAIVVKRDGPLLPVRTVHDGRHFGSHHWRLVCKKSTRTHQTRTCNDGTHTSTTHAQYWSVMSSCLVTETKEKHTKVMTFQHSDDVHKDTHTNTHAHAHTCTHTHLASAWREWSVVGRGWTRPPRAAPNRRVR